MKLKKRKISVKTRLNKDVVLVVRVDKHFYKILKKAQKEAKFKKNGMFLRQLLSLGLYEIDYWLRLPTQKQVRGFRTAPPK